MGIELRAAGAGGCRIRSLLAAAIVACAALATGCVATMIGAATVTTIDVVNERRTLGSYIDDGAIELSIRQHILRNKTLRQQTHLNATSMNGVVLVTGEARNVQVKSQLLEYIQQLEGVRQVVDQSEIAGKTGMMSRTNDTWLTAKVKTRLYANTGIDANRVKVTTERGTVYLMGLVTHGEAERATELARHIDGVVRVVKVFEYVE